MMWLLNHLVINFYFVERFKLLNSIIIPKKEIIYPYSLNMLVFRLSQDPYWLGRLRTFLKIKTRIKKVFNFFSK